MKVMPSIFELRPCLLDLPTGIDRDPKPPEIQIEEPGADAKKQKKKKKKKKKKGRNPYPQVK
jgi:hypothetical protein